LQHERGIDPVDLPVGSLDAHNRVVERVGRREPLVELRTLGRVDERCGRVNASEAKPGQARREQGRFVFAVAVAAPHAERRKLNQPEPTPSLRSDHADAEWVITMREMRRFGPKRDLFSLLHSAPISIARRTSMAGGISTSQSHDAMMLRCAPR
jgi:hypothetical protein